MNIDVGMSSDAGKFEIPERYRMYCTSFLGGSMKIIDIKFYHGFQNLLEGHVCTRHNFRHQRGNQKDRDSNASERVLCSWQIS